MQEIAGFKKIPDSLSKNLFKGENTRSAIASIVNDFVKSEINSKNVSIKQRELILTGISNNTLLFLKKDQILKEIKDKTNLDLKSIVS